MRRLAVIIICLSMIAACAPAFRPTTAGEPSSTDGPSKAEFAAASVISYAAGGLPSIVVAGLAVSNGWTLPLLATFAIGGAAYSLVAPSDSPRADRVDPTLRATAGAARGMFLFPAMMGFASRKVYAPFLARRIHAVRNHR
jgi:hypothetical protein